jgi:ABC-type multidrug transport system ATPase subunit
MIVDELTGAENIAFFRGLHPNSTDQYTQILEQLEFDLDKLDREAGDYSGGMKRKLELAISLSVDVPLYLLDEPTAALDMTTIDRLHAMLADRREEGDTILMSSHLPTDADLADQIAFVTEAGVPATGTPEALLTNVPKVVLVESSSDITNTVRDGKLFEGEVYRRGFLRDAVDPDEVTDTGDSGPAEVREPTYTDMFNYYVHLVNTQ